MRKYILTFIAILLITEPLHSQYPSFTSGTAIAQYLQPIIQSIESTTSTSFVINAHVRSLPIRRYGVCFKFDLATDSSFSNSSIVQRDMSKHCMPPVPSCLGREYLDSTVMFRVQLSQLQPNKQYFVRIYSSSIYDDVTISSIRNVFTITLPQVSPPSQPILALPQAITTSSASFRWNGAQGLPTHYWLTVATDSAFRAVLPQYGDMLVGGTQTTLTDLTPQTQYFVRIRAANGFGFSTVSQTVRFQTLSINSKLFTAESRSSALGFPSGSEYYRLSIRNLSLSQVDSVIAGLVSRNLPIVEAWMQDNSTCTPPQQSASELVLRMKEPNAMLTALGFTQTTPAWSDSCSCKNFRVYGNFPTSTGIQDDIPHALTSSISPNPATEAATISLSLPASSPVRIALYDALGREVRSIAENVYAVGIQEFSVSLDGLPSGIYFVRGNVGGQVVVRRLAVVR